MLIVHSLTNKNCYSNNNSQRPRPRSAVHQPTPSERRNTRLPRPSSNLQTPLSNTTGRSRSRSPSPMIRQQQNAKNLSINCQKVMDALKIDQTFFNSLNLDNLKSMTAKQFFDIIAHFSLKICGKNMITSASTKQKSNPETEILGFLQLLNYPYTINKSGLKTPNAQHMFKDSVGLLAWLADFILIGNESNLSDVPVICDDSFPSVEYTTNFSIEAQKAFSLWNEESEDAFANVKQYLIEKLVTSKIGCTSIDELIQKTEQLKQKNQQLRNAIPNGPSERENYSKVMEAKYDELKNSEKKLKESKSVKMNMLKNIVTMNDVVAADYKKKEKSLAALLMGIDEQRFTLSNLQELKSEIALINQEIEIKNNEIAAIRDSASYDHIEYARLKQKRIAAITKFNKFTYEIAQTIASSQFMENFNVNDYSIDTCADDKTIKLICSRLRELNGMVVEGIQRCEEQLNLHKSTKTNLIEQINQLKAKYMSSSYKHRLTHNNLNKINIKLSNLKIESEQCLSELRHQSNELKKTQHQVDQLIIYGRQSADKINSQNIQILESFESKMAEIAAAKKDRADEIDDLIKSIEGNLPTNFDGADFA